MLFNKCVETVWQSIGSSSDDIAHSTVLLWLGNFRAVRSGESTWSKRHSVKNNQQSQAMISVVFVGCEEVNGTLLLTSWLISPTFQVYLCFSIIFLLMQPCWRTWWKKMFLLLGSRPRQHGVSQCSGGSAGGSCCSSPLFWWNQKEHLMSDCKSLVDTYLQFISS